MTTVTKKVRARADQILGQFRQQFGVTEDDVAKKQKSFVVNPELKIPIGDTLEEAIQLHGGGDEGKAYVMRCYKTQAVTLALNAERIKWARSVSDSVKDSEAIAWAFKNDPTNAATIAGSGDMVKLTGYLDSIKEKIRAERQASGTAPDEDQDDDSQDTVPGQ